MFSRLFAICLILVAAHQAIADQPLASWNDTPSKAAILRFVDQVTDESSPHFVPANERIAVFDNDGTLWCEKPFYVQVAFMLDRVKQLAPDHPEWKTQEPFASVLSGKADAALASDERGLVAIAMATHANLSTEAFGDAVKAWLETARHPKTGSKYTDMVYEPMLEVLNHLRAHGFKTYIVSGGGIEFMRPWTEAVYGIPPEQVIGSRLKTEYKLVDGKPTIMRLPEIDFVDDKSGKPIGINNQIGRRPILAFGNSDGDFEMLEWTTTGDGSRLGLIVHHTDAEREYAYDRESHVGKLSRGLDEASQRGWIVVDMKNDWKTVFK